MAYMLRFIASLRAAVNAATKLFVTLTISELRLNAVKLGAANANKMARIAKVTIISISVKPSRG